MSKYLGCKGVAFVFCPETSLKELKKWLKRQWWTTSRYHIDQWAYMLFGHRAQIMSQRFDYQPSLGPHAHGKKVLFTKNGECFVQRIVITNFIAWEMEWGRVNANDGRHEFYVKKPTFVEEEKDEDAEGYNGEAPEGGSIESDGHPPRLNRWHRAWASIGARIRACLGNE